MDVTAYEEKQCLNGNTHLEALNLQEAQAFIKKYNLPVQLASRLKDHSVMDVYKVQGSNPNSVAS